MSERREGRLEVGGKQLRNARLGPVRRDDAQRKSITSPASAMRTRKMLPRMSTVRTEGCDHRFITQLQLNSPEFLIGDIPKLPRSAGLTGGAPLLRCTKPLSLAALLPLRYVPVGPSGLLPPAAPGLVSPRPCPTCIGDVRMVCPTLGAGGFPSGSASGDRCCSDRSSPSFPSLSSVGDAPPRRATRLWVASKCCSPGDDGDRTRRAWPAAVRASGLAPGVDGEAPPRRWAPGCSVGVMGEAPMPDPPGDPCGLPCLRGCVVDQRDAPPPRSPPRVFARRRPSLAEALNGEGEIGGSAPALETLEVVRVRRTAGDISPPIPPRPAPGPGDETAASGEDVKPATGGVIPSASSDHMLGPRSLANRFGEESHRRRLGLECAEVSDGERLCRCTNSGGSAGLCDPSGGGVDTTAEILPASSSSHRCAPLLVDDVRRRSGSGGGARGSSPPRCRGDPGRQCWLKSTRRLASS